MSEIRFIPEDDNGEVVQVIVLPEDGKCEGCGDPLGEEVFETEDMVVLCLKCAELADETVFSRYPEAPHDL